MKYRALNELGCFQFHDAEIKEIQLVNSKMTWIVSAINAMTTNTQNSNEKDMCIENAVIIFENVSIEKLEFGAYTVHDSNNNLIESVEATVANPEEYMTILTESTDNYCYIYGMDELIKIEDKKYRTCFNIDGGAGNYYLTFTFSSSKVEWDNYSGEAWYENPKWKKR